MSDAHFDLLGKKVWVAGHRGMVGSAIVRRLAHENCEIVTADRSQLDLRRQADVEQWLDRNKPDVIFLAAAKVGGILANATYPAEFLHDNLVIETNIIHGAFKSGVEKLLFLGSSCIYPKFAEQPIREESLLTGPLEPTNEWYAIAKIAGLKLAEAYQKQYGCSYISGMPTNLYGQGDNFDLNTSHVMPALIRKIHEAKIRGNPQVTIWGSGTPMREFLHVDDCADACIHLMKFYSGTQHVNIGSEREISIRDLALTICSIIGYGGELILDRTKPDGTPRKIMDSSKLRDLGWKPKVELEEGIESVYKWFLAQNP